MAAEKATFKGEWHDPDALVIVGLDIDAELAPDLEDTERLVSAEPTEELITSIATHGIRTPVKIVRRKLDGVMRVLVVAGRRRVRAARKANERLRKGKSDVLIRVPCVPEEGTDALVTLVVENEHKIEDTILVKARKAARMKALGHSDPEIAAAFGVSKMTLGNWRALLTCVPEVLARIEANDLPPTLGYEIGKLAPTKQLPALAKIESSGGTVKGERGRENVRAEAARADSPAPSDGDNGRGPAPRTRRVSAASLKALYAILEPSETEPFEDDYQRLAHGLIGVVLGFDDGAALTDFKTVYPHLAKVLRSALAE